MKTTRMNDKQTKYNNIITYLSLHNKVKTADFSKEFNVSIPTARKIFKKLEDKGIIRLVFGGIEFISNPQNTSTEELNKIEIAQKACTYINDYDCIFLGPGSSIAHMCPFFKNFTHLTIVTNSIRIITKLAYEKNIDLIVLGGYLQKTNYALSNYNPDTLIRDLNIKTFFMGASAIDVEKGISHDLEINFSTEKFIAKNAQQTILLADKSKFNRILLLNSMSLFQFEKIITNKDLNSGLKTTLANKNIKMIYV